MSKPNKNFSSGLTNSKVMVNKTQLLQDYKIRLKNAVRSAGENIQGLMNAVKVPTDDTPITYKNHTQAGRVANYVTAKNEVLTRSMLIVKACEELLALNNDVKSYTILRDFKVVNEAIHANNVNYRNNIGLTTQKYETYRSTTATISAEIDKEIQENFYRLT
uniref:Mediator of RNA polymerase II transcription subunit 22 n=1 Tax=Panagrellus redivivus TaxID=6233 RepID=A0A7E4VCK5_PANRE